MKCKDCYARNGEEICLIGQKSRLLGCGHYGCDMQSRDVEIRMGIEKPQTNADHIRAMADEELAEFVNDLFYGLHDNPGMCDVCDRDSIQNCKQCWLEWLKWEANNG